MLECPNNGAGGIGPGRLFAVGSLKTAGDQPPPQRIVVRESPDRGRNVRWNIRVDV